MRAAADGFGVADQRPTDQMAKGLWHQIERIGHQLGGGDDLAFEPASERPVVEPVHEVDLAARGPEVGVGWGQAARVEGPQTGPTGGGGERLGLVGEELGRQGFAGWGQGVAAGQVLPGGRGTVQPL